MSASEKLKALDAALVTGDTDHWPLDPTHTLGLAGENMVAVSSLRLALPQIVAVVEAAENECAAKERTPDKDAAYWAAQKDHPIPGVQRRIDLARALTALDDALGGVT